MESLTLSIGYLLQLGFLPRFQNLNATYQMADLDKSANQFLEMDSSLQEATLDCVIAISKISEHLRNAIYADN